MAEIIKHSYSHGCQMETLARNGRGQTYPSGGQPPVKQHTVEGHPARKVERAIPRWQLLSKQMALGIGSSLGDPWFMSLTLTGMES